MSIVKKEEITCQNCGVDDEVEIWDSVNVDLDPELREKIFSGELFVWECSRCGHKMLIPFSTLYHDMHNHFMLFFSFNEEADDKYAPFETHEAALGIKKEYIIRSVYGYMDFKEKITILELGLNDIAIERMKFMLSHLLYPELAAKGYKLYFSHVDTENKEKSEYGNINFFFHDEKEKEYYTIQLRLEGYYEQCLATKFDPRMSLSDGNKTIDQGWIERQMECYIFNKPIQSKSIGVSGDYKEGRWALVDSEGNALTEYKYWFVEPAGEGFFRAQVTGGSKYKLLYADGTELTTESYSSISKVENGFFTVHNTIRKTKTTPTRYLCGVGHIKGIMIFPPVWECLRSLRRMVKNAKGIEEPAGELYAFSAEKENKLYILSLDGGVNDPQNSHLPLKRSFNINDYIEKFVNWTLPGLQFFYRDTDAQFPIHDSYHLGEVFRAGFFMDVTTKLLRPKHHVRFLIASAHTAMLFQIDDLVKANPNVAKWNLCTLHPNSYFKVMDIYENKKTTQILLLHIPPSAVQVFGSSTLEFLNGALGEETLVQMARRSLDEKLQEEIHPRSLDEEFCQRLEAPVGLDNVFQKIPLTPWLEEDMSDDVVGLSNMIHALAKDKDIDIIVEKEDNFPWTGVKNSICEDCIYKKTIKGNGEGCRKQDKETFRNTWIKGSCNDKKISESEQSLNEYRQKQEQIKAAKETDAYALTLVRDFIETKLGGDINKLKEYDFNQLNEREYEKQKEVERFAHCNGFSFSVENTNIMRAIMSLVFQDAWPDFTCGSYDCYQYKNEHLALLFPLFGSVIGLEWGEPHFRGMDRWNPSRELRERVAAFCKLTDTIGNIIVLPTSLSYNSITNTLTKSKRLWRDYPDAFFEVLYGALTDEKSADKGMVGILRDKQCKKAISNYYSHSAFNYFMNELVLQDFLDRNAKPLRLFEVVRFDTKELDKKTYFDTIEKFLTFFEVFIPKRAEEIVDRLKYIISKSTNNNIIENHYNDKR